MHNTRLRRLQKVYPLIHTEERFRGKEEKRVVGLQRVTGLTAGTLLPKLQGGKRNEKSDPLLFAQQQVLLLQNKHGKSGRLDWVREGSVLC